MGVKAKISLIFLFFTAVFLVSATVTIALGEVEDPEIGVCKHQCEQLREAKQDEKLRCKQQCEAYKQEKERREKEKEKDRHGRGDGEHSIIFTDVSGDPREMLAKCHQQCRGSQGEKELPGCFQTCVKESLREQQKGTGAGTSRTEKGRKGGRDIKERRSNNPFVFEDQHFTTKLQTDQGSIRVLQKFTDRSELFNGIENYRVAILEAEPQTFIVPSHWDADALVFVVNGRGTISLVNPDSKESFNINRGDIFRVPAGISAYLINRDNNEKLVLAKILRSISVPGELQTFLSAGGENPESSFFNAFSSEVLQAAFDSERDDIERLFRQKKQEQQGMFKKASEEQIRAMGGGDGGRVWPFQRRGSYNIFRKDPSVQNQHGRLHEVDSDNLRDLRDINVAFSFFNITQGSMAGPFYNTKATTVAVVTKGEGGFEMACPHLSEQTGHSTGSGGPGYEGVRSRLKRGTVVVFPAGHPVVIEASNNENLEIICFGLNSNQNEWFSLAGRDSVMSQWEEEAVELTFGLPAPEAKKVINNQKERLFFKGPQRRGRAIA